jgi:hypothetical protein
LPSRSLLSGLKNDEYKSKDLPSSLSDLKNRSEKVTG